MPRIVSDSIDVYPFRRINGRAQFLIFQRRPQVAFGGTWHGIHTKVRPNEKAYEAARRSIQETIAVSATQLYSADLISHFYEQFGDAIMLTPVFAALIEGPTLTLLAPDFSDYAWCNLDEAVNLLSSSAHRWAVRHIDDVIASSGPEAEFYLIQ